MIDVAADWLNDTVAQLSVAVGAKFTTALHRPASDPTVIFAGQVITGG